MSKIRIYLIIICIIAILSVLICEFRTAELKNNACKEIGFEERHYRNGFEFCEDNQGNLYFIKLECDYFLLYSISCEAREISIGDVRVLKKESGSEDCSSYQSVFNLTYKVLQECIIDLGICCENMTREEVIDYMNFTEFGE